MDAYRKTPDEEVAESILLQFQETNLLSEEGVKKIGESLCWKFES